MNSFELFLFTYLFFDSYFVAIIDSLYFLLILQLIVVRVIPTAPPAHIAAAIGHVGQQQLGSNKQIIGKSIEYHRPVDTPQTGKQTFNVFMFCLLKVAVFCCMST
jgi:hypothetical protein